MIHFTDSNFSWLLLGGMNFHAELCQILIAHHQPVWAALAATLLVLMGMSFQGFADRSDRSREEMVLDAKRSIKRLLANFGDKLKADADRLIAAIYIRYSSTYQDSSRRSYCRLYRRRPTWDLL